MDKSKIKGKQMAAPKVNQRWFHDRLADKEISQRKFAKMVGMDPAAASYMFQGKRKMQMDEAIAFATIAGVPLEDVITHAGLQVPTAGVGMCHVVGTVDQHGELTIRQVEAPRRAACPPEAPDTVVAARLKTPGSAAEFMDGWLLYYADNIKRVPAEAIGRLVVAWVAGRILVGILRRGYARGTHTLHPWTPGGQVLENVAIERASPVLWVRTAP